LDLEGKSLACLEHIKVINHAVFSPDSSQVLTCSSDKTAKLWDLSGDLLADLKKHTESVKSAEFFADGTRVLTASDDGTAKLWNLEGKLF
jgi:WD40 repeat protein